MGMPISDFTQLEVWQEAREVVRGTYAEARRLPREEEFGLASQMRRAAVSIPTNIAEGFGSAGPKQRLRYYRLAMASIHELRCLFIICADLKLEGGWEGLGKRLEVLSRRLGRLCSVIQQSLG
jgi:four helix bundle protein